METEKEKHNKYMREWRRRNPGRFKEAQDRWIRNNPDKRKDHRLKCMYGIGLEEYKKMYEEQGGLCAICNRPAMVLDNKGRVRALSVDHDHITGKVRGLLCNKCNMAIGIMDSNPEITRNATNYLLRMR